MKGCSILEANGTYNRINRIMNSVVLYEKSGLWEGKSGKFRLHNLNYLGSQWCWFIGFIGLNNGWDYVTLCSQESTALVTQPSENGWILRRKK